VQIGSHRLFAIEPGIAVMTCVGDVAPCDVEALVEALAFLATRRLVIDARDLGQVPQSTRRLFTAPCAYEPHSFAIVGGSLRGRLVMTSILAARGFLARAAFFEGLAQAVEWARRLEENAR
jgi:hypothetical protein